ncbi:molybdopterin-dependent oxidoreductase [Chloroflexota bacterium]
MKQDSAEKIIATTCRDDCGGICPLKVHVKNGIITRIEAEDEVRACAKGRASRQMVYAPDRLLYPMKRVGERGTGEFKRISWGEALDTTANEIKRVRGKYGSSAVLFLRSAGYQNLLNNTGLIQNLLAGTGGYSGSWGSASIEGGAFAAAMTYGIGLRGVYTRDDWLNSRFIIMWGFNPVVTNRKGKAGLYLAQAREAGTRIVCVDPRHTRTAATFADQWIPIRPGTDAAMLIAMAYVIITENLYDQAYLDKYTVGFNQYKEYVLGQEDNVAKTPAWAAAITGVPAATIANLAREYGTKKPAALLDSAAPGRTAYGEQYHRAAIALACMTGNIGVHGGSAPGVSVYGLFFPPIKLGPDVYERMEGRQNPIDQAAASRKDAGHHKGLRDGSSARVNKMDIVNAILKGRQGGYPADYKLLYIVSCNYVNQWGNTNKMIQALKKLEFIVVHEQFMTATAKFADIILPSGTFMERNDLVKGGINLFYGYVNKIIDPIGETKSLFEIASELAARLGVSDYTDKTAEEWLREVVAGCKDIPDYDEFKHEGIQKIKLSQPLVSYEEQIKDPVNHPFNTPSGKIEIYSQDIANLDKPDLPPIPKYIETWESLNDPLAKKYPLQLITSHPHLRVHSQFDNIPWLKELYTHAVMMNTADAHSRGINDGDLVHVYNDRGEMAIPAKVTERIMPGVVDIPEGAWYNPDENGIDRGGCANVLTKDGCSPGGAFPCNTALVQIEKYEEV